MATRRGTRGPQERRDRSADLLDAAIHVFSEKGYGAASMQDVADRVGVLKGSLYHYISSKEELLYNVLNASHQEAVQIVDRVQQTEGSPEEQLCLYLSLMASWYLANVERVGIYFKEGGNLTGARADAVQQQRRDTLHFLDGLIDAAKGGDLVREDIDTRLASLMIFGQMNSFPDWYKRKGPYGASDLTTAFVRAVLAALAEPTNAVLALLDNSAHWKRSPATTRASEAAAS